MKVIVDKKIFFSGTDAVPIKRMKFENTPISAGQHATYWHGKKAAPVVHEIIISASIISSF